MEEKLIQGGEILDKAAKQEAMLRKAKMELEEQQHNQSKWVKARVCVRVCRWACM
jgi:hypothetical protein